MKISGRFTGASRCTIVHYEPCTKSFNKCVRRCAKCMVYWCGISRSDGIPVAPLAGLALQPVIVWKVMNHKYINIQR